jgi:CHRD domain
MIRTKTRISIVGAAALCLTGLAGIGIAQAGHVNRVTEGSLTGRQEVGPAGNNKIVGDPNGSGEVYVFGIDNDVVGATTTVNTGTLCYVLIVDKVAELDQAPGNGRAAHIHRGTAGTNGPVVANLAWPQDGQAADCISEGENGKFTAPVPAGIVQEILQYPENFYVNIHNTEYPAGAIRAQLTMQHSH